MRLSDCLAMLAAVRANPAQPWLPHPDGGFYPLGTVIPPDLEPFPGPGPETTRLLLALAARVHGRIRCRHCCDTGIADTESGYCVCRMSSVSRSLFGDRGQHLEFADEFADAVAAKAPTRWALRTVISPEIRNAIIVGGWPVVLPAILFSTLLRSCELSRMRQDRSQIPEVYPPPWTSWLVVNDEDVKQAHMADDDDDKLHIDPVAPDLLVLRPGYCALKTSDAMIHSVLSRRHASCRRTWLVFPPRGTAAVPWWRGSACEDETASWARLEVPSADQAEPVVSG